MKNNSITDTNIMLHPSIVTVLGHVDHGKTTLLDRIRKTNIVAKEHGGITQHIGAYQVTVSLKGEPSSITIKKPSPAKKTVDQKASSPKKRTVTFIDTPGHEAFAKMRGRGAKVADIAILVIAGNDGVKPQTIESIQHIKSAKIPCIVAINKIDLKDINIDKIKKQLTKAGLKLEEFGGDIPVIPVSAKTGQGIDKLLEMIVFLTEYYQIGKSLTNKFQAVVIESMLSKSKGPIATIIVRSGGIHAGEKVISENQSFRIRALYDWQGKKLYSIKAGEPAEILGFPKLPPVGSILHSKNQVDLAFSAEKHIAKVKKSQSITTPPKASIEEKTLKVVLKTDTKGTLEAITASLKDNVHIVSSGVGSITESDILFAKTTGAIIIGFNNAPSENVALLADNEKVIIKSYKVIYELFDEIREVVEMAKQGGLVNILGEAKVIALFPIKENVIAGVKIISGRIARGDQVKIIRNNEEISQARIKSLRHRKEDITRAEQGMEAGILFNKNVDFLTGDSIISIG